MLSFSVIDRWMVEDVASSRRFDGVRFDRLLDIEACGTNIALVRLAMRLYAARFDRTRFQEDE